MFASKWFHPYGNIKKTEDAVEWAKKNLWKSWHARLGGDEASPEIAYLINQRILTPFTFERNKKHKRMSFSVFFLSIWLNWLHLNITIICAFESSIKYEMAKWKWNSLVICFFFVVLSNDWPKTKCAKSHRFLSVSSFIE